MRLIAIALLFLIFGLGGGLFYSVDKRIEKKKLVAIRSNETLPDFKLVSTDGSEIASQLAIGADSSVIIFVNPGCSHCEAQLSALKGFERKLAVTIVADLKERNQDEMDRIASNYGKEFKVFFDRDGERQRRLGIETVPYTVLLDKNRVVLMTFEGERDARFLAEKLDRLSNEPSEGVRR